MDITEIADSKTSPKIVNLMIYSPRLNIMLELLIGMGNGVPST
jgi:hypothetical protein